MARFYLALLFVAVALVGADDIAPLPEGRQATVTSTVVVSSTTTITGSTSTSTVTTEKICASFPYFASFGFTGASSSFISGYPTATCRRKRGFLTDDVFIGLPRDNQPAQFYQLTPSQVMKFEPSHLPYFAPDYTFGDAVVTFSSPDVLEPSFGRQGPIITGLYNFAAVVSNIVSSVISNVFLPSRSSTSSSTSSSSSSSSTTSSSSSTSTSSSTTATPSSTTSTSSATSTSSSSSSSASTMTTTATITSIATSTLNPTFTTTSYTTTKSFFIVGSCYPASIQTCS